MIKSNKPLSMIEASSYLDESGAELNAFIRDFSSISLEQAKEMKEKLISLDLIKLNEKHLAKLIDTLPSDKEDLLKVLNDVSFSQDEIESILSIIKEFK